MIIATTSISFPAKASVVSLTMNSPRIGYRDPLVSRYAYSERVHGNEVTGIGHIALRVTDLQKAKRFYIEQLGWVLARETDRACFIRIGGITLTLIASTEQTPAADRFDPFRVGLDHLALSVAAKDLPELKQRLDAAGVRNNGIEHDNRSGADSITFHDPDDIAWEFYASPR